MAAGVTPILSFPRQGGRDVEGSLTVISYFGVRSKLPGAALVADFYSFELYRSVSVSIKASTYVPSPLMGEGQDEGEPLNNYSLALW